jgi:heme exporter protein C
MRTSFKGLGGAYWGVTLALLAAATAMAVLYAPIEATMGPVQKIFYLHLPAAMSMFLATFVVFVASIGYIWTRRRLWDNLAHAAALVAVVFCTVVLATGMIWARSAWGHWWTWSPRLTFSLILWLLYVAYLILRPSIESPERRALVCAVYGAVAFLDVPLVYLSVKLLPDIHPASVALSAPMQQTLLFSFVPVTMVCGGLIWARFRSAERQAGPEEDAQVAGGVRLAP